jgi:hypothetical protein
MNRNVLLLIVLAVLIGGGILVQKNKNSHLNNADANIKKRELLLPDLPLKDIHKVRIKDGENQVNLSEENGKWLVAERGNYPASGEKVARTLLSISEIKTTSGKHVKKENRGNYKLQASGEGQPFEAGLQVDLMNAKGDVITTIIAGNYMKSSGGASSNSFNGATEQRFVRVSSDGETVWLINDIFYDIQATPQDWLDKAFVDVRKIKDVAVTAANPGDSWSAQRKDENSEFTLTDVKTPGDALDTAKTAGLGSLLSSATFNDVLTKDKATPDFMKGAISARIDTFEDFHYDVKLQEQKEPGGTEAKDYITIAVTANIPKERKAEPNEKPEDKKKKDDEFAAKKKELEDKLAKEKGFENRIYSVSNYVIALIVKKRSEVLRDKTAAPPTARLTTPEIKIPVPKPGAPVSVTPSVTPSEPPKPAETPKPAPAPATPKPAKETPPPPAPEAKKPPTPPAAATPEAKPPGEAPK